MTLTEAADLALGHLDGACVNGQLAQHHARRSGAAGAQEHAALAVDGIRLAEGLLRAAGATRPDAPAPQPIPLHQLDTPDARALLAGLEELLPIAERVDARRGRTIRRKNGQAEGGDVAAYLNQLRHRLMLEIHGPGERVTGGRE